ncbi:MAG: CapA family protein [Clostridiales bacterium]|nr:CapA family protein [Clostridiales bacterium]
MKKLKHLTIMLTSISVMMVCIWGCGAINSDESSKSVTTTQEITTEEPTTEPPFEPTTVDIMMIGDMLMHMGVQNSGLMSDGTYNYDHLFTHIVDDVQSADISIVNQEVMIGGIELGLSGYPCFNCANEVGDGLVKAGFNTILHATNHTLDKGAIGVDNCINYWETNHPDITYLGINKTAEDKENIYIYEKDGIKIAILNYTYGTNGIALPTDRPYIVNLLDEDTVVSDLAKAQELADFIIVCPHWGTEYTLIETEEQHYWAQLFSDNGADLILGAHPHVVEPVSWLTADDGSKTLCYYSLGNYISTQQKGYSMLGAMAKVTLTNDKEGNVTIKDYAVEPLVTHTLWGSGQMTTYKLSEYTSDLAYQNRVRDYDSTFTMEYLVNTCKQVFGDLYVPEGEAVGILSE